MPADAQARLENALVAMGSSAGSSGVNDGRGDANVDTTHLNDTHRSLLEENNAESGAPSVPMAIAEESDE